MKKNKKDKQKKKMNHYNDSPSYTRCFIFC